MGQFIVLVACSDCGQPRPTLHLLRDGDGVHPRCAGCLIQLLAAVERAGTRLVLTVEPALVVAQ
jgi:hypothetical protein